MSTERCVQVSASGIVAVEHRDHPVHREVDRRQWIHLLQAIHERTREVGSPGHGVVIAKPEQRLRIVGIEDQRLLVIASRSVRVGTVVSDRSAQTMPFRRFRVECEHLRGAGFRLPEVLVGLRHGYDAHVDMLPVDEPLGDEQQLVVTDNVLRAPDELERVVERLCVEAPDLLAREQVGTGTHVDPRWDAAPSADPRSG